MYTYIYIHMLNFTTGIVDGSLWKLWGVLKLIKDVSFDRVF